MHLGKGITLANKRWKYVTSRARAAVSVYKNGSSFLRVGTKRHIKRDLAHHKILSSYGFPVPRILSEGKIRSRYYYIERSLGPKHFGSLFAREVRTSGSISPELFNRYLATCQKFAEAQLRTARTKGSLPSFKKGIHLDEIVKEMPTYKARIKNKYKRIEKRLSKLPFVLTHGDFNAFNLYPKGVIDLEDVFYAPAGFDLITNIFHNDYFPNKGPYEFHRGFLFTKQQKTRYVRMMDELYVAHGLPKLSAYVEDFEFCRAIWMVARMHKWPKIQKFRYDLFIDTYLKR